jgi:hypothetical protein
VILRTALPNYTLNGIANLLDRDLIDAPARTSVPAITPLTIDGSAHNLCSIVSRTHQ